MSECDKKSDSQIARDVTDELSWDPTVTATQIIATAKDGVVTLRGTVPHYSEKASAEKAAQRIGGVKAVADEIEVSLLDTYERSDEDIAQSARIALDWSYHVPKGVTVAVDRAWITLRGNVDYGFERQSARDAVSALMGVRGVSNDISINSSILPSNVKRRIEEALKRTADIEGRSIQVAVNGSTVTLSGTANSFSEIEDARMAASRAPGVLSVENKISIGI
jgi:osmotically-inducible protein OsmY